MSVSIPASFRIFAVSFALVSADEMLVWTLPNRPAVCCKIFETTNSYFHCLAGAEVVSAVCSSTIVRILGTRLALSGRPPVCPPSVLFWSKKGGGSQTLGIGFQVLQDWVSILFPNVSSRCPGSLITGTQCTSGTGQLIYINCLPSEDGN